MKAYITIFGFLSILYLGSYSATAQEAIKKEMAKAEYQQRTPSDIAKIQTKNLKELLKLDDSQVLSVNETLFKVEEEMDAITRADHSEVAKMAEIEKWEELKIIKLKEILTTEQFSLYMNTIKNNKR